MSARTRPKSVRVYGDRELFGPYWLQALRFVGRTLERWGAALDMWTWYRR